MPPGRDQACVLWSDDEVEVFEVEELEAIEEDLLGDDGLLAGVDFQVRGCGAVMLGSLRSARFRNRSPGPPAPCRPRRTGTWR